jgi:hypothetical protein
LLTVAGADIGEHTAAFAFEKFSGETDPGRFGKKFHAISPKPFASVVRRRPPFRQCHPRQFFAIA